MVTVIDATTEHNIYVERLKQRAANEVIAIINQIGLDVSDEVLRADLQTLTRRELDALVARLNRLIRDEYGPVEELIKDQLREFGAYEGQWQGEMLVNTKLVDISDLGVASDADIWAATQARPFDGKYLKGWLDGLPVGSAKRVRQTVIKGYSDGLSSVEVAREIRGTRSIDGDFSISKRGAEAMVRTAFSHTSTVARDETYKKNKTIKTEQYLAILDTRTTLICANLDGRVFPVGEGPKPPQHIACRSTRIPVTSSNKERVNNRQTYSQWLERQSASVQDDILGKKKGQLYREGGLDGDDMALHKFVNRAGQAYTLDELKQKDAAAWARAFGEEN